MLAHPRRALPRSPIPFIAALAAVACAAVAQAGGTLEIDAEASGALTVAVWIGDEEAGGPLRAALLAADLPEGAGGQALLAARKGHVLVEITTWPSRTAAETYAVPYLPAVPAYWRRVFVVDRVFGRVPLEIGPDASVQWSEFLVREPARQAELARIVGGMVAAMAGGGAETLAAIGQLRSVHGTSIGLLGLWDTKEGFHVFERNATFGPSPYWEPYADNAHWMLGVVRIR
jgi:hypothetical protein